MTLNENIHQYVQKLPRSEYSTIRWVAVYLWFQLPLIQMNL